MGLNFWSVHFDQIRNTHLTGMWNVKISTKFEIFFLASSSEAVPIDNGSDDEYAQDDDDSNLVPPHTPADNYLISSSTGVNDSVPPTPVDVHGDGDLSVPSPNPVLRQPRHHMDVDDMIDSTVDSSGYSMDHNRWVVWEFCPQEGGYLWNTSQGINMVSELGYKTTSMFWHHVKGPQ